MTLITGEGHVRADECKTGHGGVIKLGAGPSRGCVALLTVVRESRGHVIWILRPIEVVLVATDTSRRRTLELATDVTCSAVQAGVRARQDKPR